MSNQFLVVGSPIDHSKSPVIHRAAYRVLGLDWDYGRLEVGKGGLRQVTDNAPEALRGFSVTMPLKEEAAKLANTADEFVRRSGAANTLVRSEQGWAAYNTDVFGIVQAVRMSGDVPGDDATILGSGATAYSAMMALQILAPSASIRVFARNRATAKGLIQFGKGLGLKVKATRSFRRAISKKRLTISTLPAGVLESYLAVKRNLPSTGISGLLLDVAYEPWPSAAAQVWLAAGARVSSGLDMLIWQAVAQLRIFTAGNPNEPLPNEAAVLEAMRHSV